MCLQLRLGWRFVVLYLAALCGTELELGLQQQTRILDPRQAVCSRLSFNSNPPALVQPESLLPSLLPSSALSTSFFHTLLEGGDKGGKTWGWGTTAMQIGRGALRFQDTAPELLAPIRLTSTTSYPRLPRSSQSSLHTTLGPTPTMDCTLCKVPQPPAGALSLLQSPACYQSHSVS